MYGWMPSSAASCGDATGFSHCDVQRLIAHTFIEHVEHRGECASTNDLAIELAGRGEMPLPGIVIADRQTAGRGRGANQWWSGPGALTISIVLDAVSAGLRPERWSQIALTAGLAGCEAIGSFAAGHDARLKWPNDVYLDGRKICGILTEVPSQAAGRVVVGVGINVNNSLADAPEELRLRSTSLIDATGTAVNRVEVLVRLLQVFEERLGMLARGDDELFEAWQRCCLLTGRLVQITSGDRVTTGYCHGIDASGALRVQTGTAEERCVSGTVQVLD